MPTCPAEESILAFVEARLRPAQRAAIEAHAAGCEACSSLIAAVTTAWFHEGKLADAAEPERRTFAEGQRVGPYTLLEHAGSGSMGDVYRAHDDRIGRDVALKTLPPRFAIDPDRLARFQKEARATGALAHPNVLTIFDVGTHEGVPYLVAEWLRGRTLHDRLFGGALPPREVLSLGLQLARGLAAAHDKGIVHRDLKPANIFLGDDGVCKILDFGLAKLAETLAEGEATQPGILLGTAGYMAPEQVRGLVTDRRADIFSLGTVLYEMASGRPAFGGSTAVDRMSAALRDEPPPLPGDLGAILARCLAKDPERRFQSAHDLAFCLESQRLESSESSGKDGPSGAKEPEAQRRPRFALAASALLALAIAVAAGFMLSRGALRDDGGGAPRPTYRPLTFRKGQVLSARFSSDEHTVVYGAAWDGPRAEVFTTRAEGPGSRSLGLNASVLSVSSRGELALLLEPRHLELDSDHHWGTLARMPLGGGAPRAVIDDAQEADWGPDGDTLAVVRRGPLRYRLEYPVGRVRYETEGWISHARVSPGGERIAFLDHPNPNDDRGSVMVIEGDGKPRQLSTGWAGARGLAWDPAGEEVWFTASKTDADFAMFAVDLKGRERLVDRVAGRVLLHDVARGGRALVDHQTARMGLVVGHRGAEAERELTWSDSSFLTAISPDGSTVAFTEVGASEGATYGAYLRATDGAPPVRLGEGQPLSISPDGKWVLVMRYGASLELSLVPTGSGHPQPLAIAPLAVVLGASFLPDGRHLVLSGNEASRPARLWIYEPGASAPAPITREGVAPMVVVSPDGARFAGVDMEGALRIFSARGEEIAVVPGRFPGQRAVGWEKGGDAVFLRTEALPVLVSKVELASGASAPHLTLPARSGFAGLVAVLTLSLAEDGESYAYSYYEVLSRLYLIEGLRARP